MICYRRLFYLLPLCGGFLSFLFSSFSDTGWIYILLYFFRGGELVKNPANAKPEAPPAVVHDDVPRIEEEADSAAVATRVKATTPQVAVSANVVPGSTVVITSSWNEDAVPIDG